MITVFVFDVYIIHWFVCLFFFCFVLVNGNQDWSWNFYISIQLTRNRKLQRIRKESNVYYQFYVKLTSIINSHWLSTKSTFLYNLTYTPFNFCFKVSFTSTIKCCFFLIHVGYKGGDFAEKIHNPRNLIFSALSFLYNPYGSFKKKYFLYLIFIHKVIFYLKTLNEICRNNLGYPDRKHHR